MDKTTRTYKLHRLLHGRRTVVTLQQVMDELQCSRATANRVIKEMREEFTAPIEFDRDRGGYCYGKVGNLRFDLPGVWFNETEMLALLTMEQLLAQMGNSYLSKLLAPARERVSSMLGTAESRLTDRLQIIEHMQRRTRCDAFEPVLAALVQQRQLHIRYHTRGSDERSERTVSPQRMTHYRSNWYLDAWCHHRQAMRRFALDAIEAAQLLDESALSHASAAATTTQLGGYGAFRGEATQLAVLVFSADAAKWVADEQWHPAQQGCWLDDGRYELRLPYANDRELMMDILRYGNDVVVMAPANLRAAVAQALRAALTAYEAI